MEVYMSISKFNKEGYYDPTPYEAISKIEAEERKFRPLVYICSPYAGDVQNNVENARKYCRYAVDKGYIPIAPHLHYPQFLNEDKPQERKLGLFFGNVLMDKCAEVWVFGDHISAGMAAEIKRAKRKHYILKYIKEVEDNA